MDNVEKNFGRRLKELRKKKYLSQSELAEMLGVDEKYVSRLETATSTPSFSMIIKLSNALKVEPDRLFKFINTNSKIDWIKIITKKLKGASEEDVQLIYKLVECIID